MISSFFSESERELASFRINIFKDTLFQTKVRIIDMEGWLLVECYTQPFNELCYFSIDEVTGNLEWIDMDDGKTELSLEELKGAILQNPVYRAKKFNKVY